PLNHDEMARGSTYVVGFDSCLENELKIIGAEQFKFDHIFRPEDNQEAIFEQTSPLVVSGSYLPYLGEVVQLSEERSDTMRYEMSVSMLQIYNEKIRDLLVKDAKQPAKKLKVILSTEGTHEVPGLSEVRVHKTGDVWKLLESGSRARSVGSTNANEFSSRSHCLLRVTVVGENLVNGQRTRSRLWLVDLAGSVRVGKVEVEGERLTEAQYIIDSLSSLGDVISALALKESHIPYRNSKLTHVLESSLGGDCKTLMFVQISPNSADLGETVFSLNFASRVRGVELGPISQTTSSARSNNTCVMSRVRQCGDFIPHVRCT
ncbi:kinesin-like protein KIN-14S, partial [Tanacetum coccineum]